MSGTASFEVDISPKDWELHLASDWERQLLLVEAAEAGEAAHRGGGAVAATRLLDEWEIPYSVRLVRPQL